MKNYESVKFSLNGLKVGKPMIRCSSLPSFFSCPPSVLNPQRLVQVRVLNGMEDLGTDIHEAIQHTVETGEINLRKIEGKYSGDNVDRAKTLYATGLRVVHQAKKEMKKPVFEVEVEFETEKYRVVGHVDILDQRQDGATIIDFKTGRTRDDHYHQMAGYAVGAWAKAGYPGEFTVDIKWVYLESNDSHEFTMTARDMTKWIKELNALPTEQYAVNRRCIYCNLNNTCPTFRDYLKGSVAFILGTEKLPTVRIRKMTAEAKTKLSVTLKMASTAVARIREFIKDDALANGDIPLGNGNKYTIRTKTYKTLLTNRALPVLAKYVSASDLSKASRISLPTIIAAALKRVKGPLRGILAREIEEKLIKAGAIVESVSPTLETIPEDEKCQSKKKSVFKKNK